MGNADRRENREVTGWWAVWDSGCCEGLGLLFRTNALSSEVEGWG